MVLQMTQIDALAGLGSRQALLQHLNICLASTFLTIFDKYSSSGLIHLLLNYSPRDRTCIFFFPDVSQRFPVDLQLTRFSSLQYASVISFSPVDRGTPYR